VTTLPPLNLESQLNEGQGPPYIHARYQLRSQDEYLGFKPFNIDDTAPTVLLSKKTGLDILGVRRRLGTQIGDRLYNIFNSSRGEGHSIIRNIASSCSQLIEDSEIKEGIDMALRRMPDTKASKAKPEVHSTN
jgi:hypothetical protein